MGILILATAALSQGLMYAEKVAYFPVYTDAGSQSNHYIPSGWIGDHRDLSMDESHGDQPHSGSTSIKFVYAPKKFQGQGWVGVYWQNPANNWGSEKMGYDLRGLTKLTFWARGEEGGEVIGFSVGGIKGAYPDSCGQLPVNRCVLTSGWKEYEVSLRGRDLSHVIGGFVWTASRAENPKGAAFYLDDIIYE